MSSLSEVRVALADDIRSTGYRVTNSMTGGITPPVVVCAIGDPWIEQSDTFELDQVVVHLELFLVTGTGTNEKAVSDLEAMVTKVFHSIDAVWNLDGISQPFISRPNSAEYLTCNISVSQIIKLTE